MNENVFDLIDTNNGITRFKFGTLEKTFDVSLCKNEFIKCIKVRNKDGKICVLRYTYYTLPVNQKINDSFEKYIKKHYELV